MRALSPADQSGRVPSAPGPRPSPPPSVPSPPVPFLSSRNGAGAARGRAPRTRLALGLALSATARLAPPRALPQSLAPEAPLSRGGGSCFRFFLSLQSGVASSTQPPLPLPQRRAAAADCCGGGDWGTAETASAPALGKGAFGGRAPRASGFGAGQARDPMRLRGYDWRLSLLFFPRRSPGLLLQLLLLIQRLREKWGGSPWDSLAGAFARPVGRGQGVRGASRPARDVERCGRCPLCRASLHRAGAQAQQRRRNGGGVGAVPLLLHTYLPFRQQLCPCSHRLWRGGC